MKATNKGEVKNYHLRSYWMDVSMQASLLIFYRITFLFLFFFIFMLVLLLLHIVIVLSYFVGLSSLYQSFNCETLNSYGLWALSVGVEYEVWWFKKRCAMSNCKFCRVQYCVIFFMFCCVSNECFYSSVRVVWSYVW